MAEIQELSEMTDMAALMRRWEEESSASTPTNPFDPTQILTRMAEIVEAELENFNKNDPDPFDERHPSRSYPTCNLGQVLKVIFKKDVFMDKLVNDYLRDNFMQRGDRTSGEHRDSTEVNIAACRLVIDVLPGLEAAAVFKTPEADSLILRLFSWTEKAQDPLKSYAVGLLAAAMEIQDTAAVFREQNTKLVPVMLKWLWELQETMNQQRQLNSVQQPHRPFAHLNHDLTPNKKKVVRRSSGSCGSSPRRRISSPPLMSPPSFEPPSSDGTDKAHYRLNGAGARCNRLHPEDDEMPLLSVSDHSNSSWAEMESYVIASASIYPLTLAAKQMLILRYLTPMGEYQEFLGYVFEHNAVSLILNYTNIRETRETRLAFEALKYLAALLCHKKVALEFIAMGGLQRLLEVPRPSVAATGVSICLYYLAYCEDAMERICMLPKYMITELVSYALWLLECSHNSGRCHATMFFGLSFQFRIVLDEFDAQDGLRKMYNVMSTLPILTAEDGSLMLNDEEQCSYRQIVRHVTVALKRYYEAHLAIKHQFYTRMRSDRSSRPQPAYKGQRSTPEEVQQQIETLLELMPLHASWPCVDHFFSLGGITLLLRIIAFAYDWNFGGRFNPISEQENKKRAETVQSALAVLCVCCVRPTVQLLFCERLQLPDNVMSVGMNIILGSCEGEIVPDPEVQKTALRLLISCVAAPLDRVGSQVLTPKAGDVTNKRRFKSGEDLIQKVWESARENNGIIVLLMLMMVKTPITDADELRALACRAMSGLVRCEKVRQIVSKLPVLTNGSMQVALKDPILQEKRAEHVQFQKHYLELITRIMGNKQSSHSPHVQDLSLTSIHRANVVAQTPITYNKTQLYQLIHQQLLQDGLSDAAAALVKEAGLSLPKTPAPAFPSNRIMLAGRSQGKNHATPTSRNNSFSTPSTPTSPIKLTLNRRDSRGGPSAVTTPNRSLQKQTSMDSWTGGVPAPKPPATPTLYNPPPVRVSLHSIVTEYLINQHALCKNPMVTCPQFNLFVPHKCPEPKARIAAPINFNMRLLKRQSGFRVSNSMDIRLSHSRFCPERTIRMGDDDGMFTCCEFSPNSSFIIMGTNNGDLRLYNAYNGTEEAVYQCHESVINHIECNREGNLVLTSSTWRRPLSALWTFTNLFDMKISLDDEEYTEFSKTTQDKILGTKSTTATVYDIETGVAKQKMTPGLSNNYTRNRATFNPTDELVLTDGVLFDVRSGEEIYKFDKLNSVLSGVFHPNGLEILSNMEVWDLRTFHLLRTVPALEKQEVVFNHTGTVMYAYSFEQENDDDFVFESSFKTLDSRDYCSIATIDTKKEIYHLACNKHDTQLAVIENQSESHESQETSVRIYDVGRRREQDDDVAEDEDEEVSEDSGSNSDNDAGNNILMQLMQAAGDAVADVGGDDDDDEDFLVDSPNEDDGDGSGGDEDDGNSSPSHSASSSLDDDLDDE